MPTSPEHPPRPQPSSSPLSLSVLRLALLRLALPLLAASACAPPALLDAGPDDAPPDASPGAAPDGGAAADGGARDAGSQDAGFDPDDAGDGGPFDGGAPDSGPPQIDAGPEVGVRVRVVAANLTSGNDQSWDPGHGVRILQGLSPDVVLVQEMNVGDDGPSALQDFADRALSMQGASWTREPVVGIPNGVLSRFPILESGSFDDPYVDNRGFAWARIDVPGARDLWAFSVHLLTSSASVRDDEASALLAHLQALPPEDLVVVGGDLNTDVPTEACLATLDAALSLARVPVDQGGDRDTSATRSRPYDWVLPDDDLEALHVPVRIGAASYEDGLVFDTRVYAPLQDVAPAQQSDSAASNMQHMPVVKDFLVGDAVDGGS